MITEPQKNVTTQGYNLGQSRGMSIDANSLVHLMGVLTNLYSDKPLAVVREYSTNAYDSHVQAGKANVPIKVTLPNPLEPVFKVQDFGVGLSQDEVFDIYGAYGASTKRESNDFNGQLGLGCKSALSLTNQFSLRCIKDGKKNLFSIHLDENGIGNITHMGETNTDEGNGVEVSIPVADTTAIVNAANKFYKYFPVTPEFVGKQPETLGEPTLVLKKDKIYYYEGGDREYIIVMGGVGYPVPYDYNNRYRQGKFVVYADMGDVSFTPSREALLYNDKTEEYVSNMKEEIDDLLERVVQEKITAAKTYAEAVSIYGSVRSGLGLYRSKFMYRGIEVSVEAINGGESKYLDHNGALRSDANYALRLHSLPDAIFLGKYENKSRRLKHYMKEHNIEEVWFGGYSQKNGKPAPNSIKEIADVPFPEETLAGIHTFTQADLDAIKFTRKVGNKSKAKEIPEYCVLQSNGSSTRRPVDDTKTLVRIKYTTKDSSYDVASVLFTMNSDIFSTHDFVFIEDNRVDKFKTLYPNSISTVDYVRGVREKFPGYTEGFAPTTDERYAITALRNVLPTVDTLDEEVNAFRKKLPLDNAAITFKRNFDKLNNALRVGVCLNADDSAVEEYRRKVDAMARNIHTKYPMLKYCGTGSEARVAVKDYINSLFSYNELVNSSSKGDK